MSYQYYIDWPAPKEAAVETAAEEADKDKFVETKVKSKGQWKPFTPTLVHASSSPRATSARKSIRRTGPSESRSKDMKKSSTTGARRSSKSKEIPTDGAPTPATTTSTTKTDKEEEKKPKARSVRPKGTYRPGARKTPAFINVDADTLKMYIMQQM